MATKSNNDRNLPQLQGGEQRKTLQFLRQDGLPYTRYGIRRHLRERRQHAAQYAPRRGALEGGAD